MFYYQWLDEIFMVPRMFERLGFNCILEDKFSVAISKHFTRSIFLFIKTLLESARVSLYARVSECESLNFNC